MPKEPSPGPPCRQRRRKGIADEVRVDDVRPQRHERVVYRLLRIGQHEFRSAGADVVVPDRIRNVLVDVRETIAAPRERPGEFRDVRYEAARHRISEGGYVCDVQSGVSATAVRLSLELQIRRSLVFPYPLRVKHPKRPPEVSGDFSTVDRSRGTKVRGHRLSWKSAALARLDGRSFARCAGTRASDALPGGRRAPAAFARSRSDGTRCVGRCSERTAARQRQAPEDLAHRAPGT